MLSEKQESTYPESFDYLPAALLGKVHSLMLGSLCKAATDLCGTSSSLSLVETLVFKWVEQTQIFKSQNSTKIWNHHGFNVLQ